MKLLKKFLLCIPLYGLGLLIAGAYGALHDQISFTISEEYFTRFKYAQFGLTESPLPDRIKATIIGFQATWWMGLPIGIIVCPLGMLNRNYSHLIKNILKSYLLMVLVTLIVGILGLGYGFIQTNELDLSNYSMWYIPANLESPRNFVCVGYMHNAGYTGGFIGMFFGVIAQVILARKSNAQGQK